MPLNRSVHAGPMYPTTALRLPELARVPIKRNGAARTLMSAFSQQRRESGHARSPRRVICDWDETSSRSRHVGCGPESGSKIRVIVICRDRPLRVDGIARRVIQAPKPEYSSYALRTQRSRMGAIKSMLPNKPRGVPRVNDRRVLNGIFWVLRSGAPWRDPSDNFGPYTSGGRYQWPSGAAHIDGW